MSPLILITITTTEAQMQPSTCGSQNRLEPFDGSPQTHPEYDTQSTLAALGTLAAMMYGWQSDRANGWLNGNAKSTERGQLHWQTRVLRVPPLCAIRTHVGRAARGVDPVVIGGGGN